MKLLAILSSGILFFGAMYGCSTGFRVPPAEQPDLISNGLRITGSGGSTTMIGELNAYCNDYTVPAGPHGRGFYVTIRMPALNHPEVGYAGIVGDFWGALTAAEQSLSQGPRPWTQQQIQNLQGNYIGYFIHDDFLTGNDYHVVLGILLGQGTSENGMVEIRSANTDPQNTGLQARSNPLEIPVTEPVRVTASASPSAVDELQPLTIQWNASNADRVEITGDDFPGGTTLPVSGSQTVTTTCTGDRDSALSFYQVRASRTGCPVPLSDTSNLSVTVNTSRNVTQFEGIPRFPTEGSSFTLRWKTTGASGVTLSGPNGFSQTAAGSEGQTPVVAPSVPQCRRLQNFNYQLEADWPSCGTRTATALVSVATVTQPFTLTESGGSQCRSSHTCIVEARSRSEARSCASGICGAIQQGCTWQ